MKRILSVIFIFFSFIFISTAQKNSIEYGFQTGVNINSAHGAAINTASKKSSTGFSIGGHFKWQTSKHFALKALAAYEQNGWSYRSLVFPSGPGDAFIKLHYLNIPLVAEYSFGNKVKFNIDGGIFVGFLLHNKVTVKITGATPSTENSTSESYRPINFGASAGAGAEFPLTNKVKLDIGVRNNFGLISINKSPYGQPSTIQTNVFSIVAGVSFGL